MEAARPDARTDAPRQGLSTAEAAERLAVLGPNEPAAGSKRSVVVDVLLLFANPLVIILLIAGVVSGFLGQLADAGLIVAIVVLSAAVNFSQTFRSERAIERLRDRVATTATVLRDGSWREIPRRDVVEGDLIRLGAGDVVPADARLLEARDLHVVEAALTGESMPAEKEALAPAPAGTEPDPRGQVFLGTSVVSGTALALVTATGPRTQFGGIASRLRTRPPETEFERGLARFGMLILRAVFFLVLFILVVSLALHRPAFESLLFAVALAVGLTPEFLPMITTVTLAEGAMRMARQHVIVKHLPAIQNFGSIDILCSDKTGTLTAGVTTFDRSIDALGTLSDEPLALAFLNSRFETGIKSPLDAAIIDHWDKVKKGELKPPSSDTRAEGYDKRDEIPFDFERRRLSIVVEKDGERTLICKGAPESLLPLATHVEQSGARVAMDDALRSKVRATFEGESAQGFRLLAVATRSVDTRDAYNAGDERELTIIGFLTFTDPPVPEAKEAIEALRRDGVRVKILTGDSELVARHVCAEVGLDVSEIVLGTDLEKLGDTALAAKAEDATVFARVSPAQKNRIILALKRRSHVVGYIGDGVNDAPSLHAADVGISVASAVDVARDAADIIMMVPGLQILHAGILEGRRAFGNVMKYVLMGTSSNFGNMFSMAGAALLLPFLPMLPTQILLNNFLYDLAQITIPTDRVDDSWLRRPQRWDIKAIRNFMLIVGPLSSLYDFLTFYVLLHFFHAGEVLFHTGWFVESLITQTLVLFVIRTMKSPFRSRPSLPLALTTMAVVFVGAVLPFSVAAKWLGFVPLPLSYFGFLAAASATYLLLVEVVKRRLAIGVAGKEK